jgi:DNA/RNA endonuclease YhcR with UshA esterase domain
MRSWAILVVLLLAPALLWADDKGAQPLTPAEAAKHVNEKCTVVMEVKSTGKSGRGNAVFLNSEENYRNAKNFTVFLDKEALTKFKKAKIDDPAAHFKGKTIRVSGTVKLYRDKPEIAVVEPDQVQVVEKR